MNSVRIAGLRRAVIRTGAAGAVTAALAAIAAVCVPPLPDVPPPYPGGVVLRDSSGETMRVGLGPDDADCRPVYTVNPRDWIARAAVASEDGEFWSHCGVRPLSVLRACFQNVTAGRRVSGASTITMQAVRLMAPHPKSMAWKAVEAVQAIKLEMAHDKAWILTQYLNRAPFGSNFIGVEAAAQGWFGKRARDLGPGEAAMLAGLLQAPSRYRPDRHLDRALKRRNYVLGRMEETGAITASERAAAMRTVPEIRHAARPFAAPHFCDWVGSKVTPGDHVTTLDPEMQRLVESAVDSSAVAGGWHVAAVVIRVAGGEVAALACSGDYFSPDSGQVNTAVAARPAGSTLKPFLLAQAFDAAQATPDELLPDLPCAFGGYSPANFNGGYRGDVSARDALVLSLNLPFVELLRRVGVPGFAASLRALGFSNLGDSDGDLGLGLAIGNAQTTLVELANAYATFARGGVHSPVRFVSGTNAPYAVRRFSEGAAYLVSDILSGTARSTAALGHVADVTAPRFAWKTGTSAAYRDAWTVAWNPEYVVGVWCGHLRGGFGDESLVGVKAAAPVAWRIARGLYPGRTGPWFARPQSVRRRRVCASSGMCAGPDCTEVREADYIVGRSSNALCGVHVRDASGRCVERTDGFRAAYAGNIRQTAALAFLKPCDGSVFRRMPEGEAQRVVCTVTGNVNGGRLWWFVDGTPAGETQGADPFVWTSEVGEHTLACATAAGVSASVRVRVKDL